MTASGIVNYFILLGGAIGLAAGLLLTLRAIKLI